MAAAPDGPRSPFGIGEFLRFRRDPLQFVQNNARRFGDIVPFRLASRIAFQVNHPDLVRELLVTNSADHLRGPVMQRARLIMGNGLLTSEEPLHTEQRRKLQPLFHRDRLSEYQRIIESSARACASSWHDGQQIDVRDEMLRVSLDVVGKSLFGSELESDARRITEAVNSFMLMMDSVFFPWPDLLLRLPLPAVRRFHRGIADLDAIIARLGMESMGRDECITFLLAGHETVANALTFALLLIAQHPEIAGRIADDPDYSRAVLAEAMRLYPPVWILARQMKQASTIGDVGVPARSVIFVSQWVVHRDSRFFDDPLQFMPERFLQPKHPRFAYFPFGAGPRQCIGEGLAWMEGTIVLAEIARRWRLELISAPEPPLMAKVTLRPAAPVVVRVTTR